MPAEVTRFQTYINYTPCCIVAFNDGTIGVLAINGLPSQVLAAAYRCASEDQLARIRFEADRAILEMSEAAWAAHEARRVP